MHETIVADDQEGKVIPSKETACTKHREISLEKKQLDVTSLGDEWNKRKLAWHQRRLKKAICCLGGYFSF